MPLSEKLYDSIKRYLDDWYLEEPPMWDIALGDSYALQECRASEAMPSFMAAPSKKQKRNLDEVVNHMEDTFSQMLLRLIDEKGLTEAETYKKANIDRKLFSKIRNDIHYKPSKPTVIAFAIALGLNLDETKDLLLRAGFALSHSSKFDLIIEFFINEGNYNIFAINEALIAFDQSLLGV